MSLRTCLLVSVTLGISIVATAAPAGAQRPADVKLVQATPPTTSAQEALLVDELRAARQSGDSATARTLQAALDALHGVNGPQPAALPDGTDRVQFPTGDEQSGGERWAGDVRITESDMDRREPSLAAAPNGELFAAVEKSDGWIRLYRSGDGGQSWAWFVEITSGTGARNPSLIYAEGSTAGTWLYVAYVQENADGLKDIRVYRQDPNNMDNWDFIQVTVDIPDTLSIYPRICSDNALFGAYYLYVTWTSNYVDYYPALFSRSTDYGLTWSATQNLTGGAENSTFLTRPDVGFGTAGLFVAFEKLGWNGSSWITQVWITRSTNYGTSWGAPVQFLESNACFHPSVAAAVGSNALVVGYTSDYGTDTDVHYAASTDAGATYNVGSSLSWSYDDEDSTDLAASLSGGRFHAAYRHVNDIWYTSADVGTPTSWTSAITVNDTGQASGTYPLPSICTDPPALPTTEACIAWTDFRNPFYDAYFDHAFTTCVGDMNCDGVIDFGDINPFVTFLSNFAAWQAAFPGCSAANGDINCDAIFGQGSFGDINPFVALMTQCGAGCICPGPVACP